MTSVYGANKKRGRAFQAKLAEMAGGMNVGTLGGEDVMHPEFSYEAKTYNKNAKTYGGKDWIGEKLLAAHDQGLASYDFVILQVKPQYSVDYASLMMLRWQNWQKIVEQRIEKSDLLISIRTVVAKKFKGNTYMEQGEKNCPDAKIPIVVVHTTGYRHIQDIVLIRELYFRSLLEKIY